MAKDDTKPLKGILKPAKPILDTENGKQDEIKRTTIEGEYLPTPHLHSWYEALPGCKGKENGEEEKWVLIPPNKGSDLDGKLMKLRREVGESPIPALPPRSENNRVQKTDRDSTSQAKHSTVAPSKENTIAKPSPPKPLAPQLPPRHQTTQVAAEEQAKVEREKARKEERAKRRLEKQREAFKKDSEALAQSLKRMDERVAREREEKKAKEAFDEVLKREMGTGGKKGGKEGNGKGRKGESAKEREVRERLAEKARESLRAEERGEGVLDGK